MPRIELEQDSDEWKEYRNNKLGASDVAAILGKSPYLSSYDLWLQKTGKGSPFSGNAATSYGKAMEPILRDRFCSEYEEGYMPAVYLHDEFEFLMASLDGVTLFEDKILEIKACNREVFDLAKNGVVADHYYPQLQLQLSCVPTSKEVNFYCYNGGDTCNVVVKRDDDFINDMLEKCKEFYDYILNDTPPPINEDDCLLIEDNEEFAQAALEWKKSKMKLDLYKKIEEEHRKKLIDLTDDGNVQGYGVIIKKNYSKRTDYKKACQVNGVDLAEYEKPFITWSVKELK